MRGSTGILLIAVGLILLYVVLSDKYSCFVQFYDCLLGNDYKTPEGFTKSDVPIVQKSQPKGFDIWGLINCSIFGGQGCPQRGGG